MNKYDFIEYAAKRYGVDNSVAETLEGVREVIIQAPICVSLD